MIEVTLYSRQDCHLCELAQEALNALQTAVPHHLNVIDVDSDPKLQKEFGFEVPVIVVGPYTLRAPIDAKDLEISLRAAEHRDRQIEQIDQDIATGKAQIELAWTGSDSFSLWLSRHYLALLNILVVVYLGLPFLAPVLMNAGWTTPAHWIYTGYSYVCHQLAYRSWFLFGEQAVYPRALAGLDGLKTLNEVSGINDNDLLATRNFTGDSHIGYKVALCERDVAIYAGILLFGLLYGLFKRKFPKIPWYLWLILAIFPIGLDGFSQLITQLFAALPDRESTPFLRTLTGFMFGFFSCWYFYPMVEESMKESLDYLGLKLQRYTKQQSYKLRKVSQD